MHDWDKWSDPKSFKIHAEQFIGYQEYRPYSYDADIQKRFCKNCNKMQQRMIKI
jgi:hypothetical protein